MHLHTNGSCHSDLWSRAWSAWARYQWPESCAGLLDCFKGTTFINDAMLKEPVDALVQLKVNFVQARDVIHDFLSDDWVGTAWAVPIRRQGREGRADGLELVNEYSSNCWR